jgi:hypothetical protein
VGLGAVLETLVWTGTFVLTKTQVTSSPSLTSIAFGGLRSLHELEVDVQPGIAVSVTEYTPGSSCPVVRWSPSARPISNDLPLGRAKTKAKLADSPFGSVCTRTTIFAPGSAPTLATDSVTTNTATAVHVERKRTRRAALLVSALFLMWSSPAVEPRTDPVRCRY